MANPLLIAPSILSADFAAMGAACRALEAAGADWIHVDVMDGHFVPNLTFGPQMVAALRPHVTLPLDVHLMIAPADPYIAAFAAAGADRLSVHLEAGRHLHRSLQAVAAAGCKAGVAINPATPVEALRDVLDMVDLVNVMTVNPGFGGQKLIPSALDKIARIRAMIGARPVRIEVDGGVDRATAAQVVAAGADVLVAGSAVFSGGTTDRLQDYANNIKALREAATRGA